MNDIFELAARYDARKSFYGKAHVLDDGESYTLISYSTPVMRVTRDGIVSRAHHQPASQTTARHMREFAKQFCDGVDIYDATPTYL